MRFTFGYTSPTTVEVTNRHGFVEYRILSGHKCSEKDVRAEIGNIFRGAYCHSYSGNYSERSNAVKRIENEIAELEENLEKLRFSLKVTKKKTWKEVK